MPLLLVTLVIVVSVIEVFNRHNESAALSRKLDALVVAHAAGVAPSVWILDNDRMSLVLKSIIADPEVSGAFLQDEFGSVLSAEGKIATPTNADLQRSEVIRYQPSGSDQIIGRLTITLTDALVVKAQQKRLTIALGFALVLSMLIVLSALIANRWSIGIPLNRLLNSIQDDHAGQRHKNVDWDSNDEIGTVIKAFNDLQQRQQVHEKDLRSARDNLEQRVRDRTMELVSARDEARAAQRSMSHFLAGVSHELRTPLNAILGMSEVMSGGQLGEVENKKHLEYVNDIHHSGQYLLDLINDILDLSKIESSQMEVNDSVFNVGDAIEDAIRLSDQSGQEATPHMKFDKPDSPIFITADKRLITQIAVNLLSNAIKFTPKGGNVASSVFLGENGECHITVSDTGCGIAEDELDRVMEPFVQSRDPYLRNSEGTGLGLSLVKAMTELHDGVVTLSSVLGEGTTVQVSLPAERVSQAPDLS
jgi:signal transduction histidine kinase